jgi:hypothetical protein
MAPHSPYDTTPRLLPSGAASHLDLFEPPAGCCSILLNLEGPGSGILHPMTTQPSATELKMDPSSLYREEMFTDRKMGAIRVLTPVKSDGAPDGTRKVLYVGETQLLTQAGLLPLVFELDATSLADAVELFASGAADAVERTRRELEDLRREAASSIITPDRMPGLLGGPGGPGGLPGGGKLRLR